VTYSEPAVIQAIEQRFIPIQVNTTLDSSKPTVEKFRQAWTPDLRVLATDGFELYRWNGYLPPFEFLPQLLVAQAQAYLRSKDEASAAAIYDDVLRRFPTSAVAPEAQYFYAVATYKQSHIADDLLGNWQRLQSRYPNSIWRIKQSFTEGRPTTRPAQARR
jgi:TolA-binding protein